MLINTVIWGAGGSARAFLANHGRWAGKIACVTTDGQGELDGQRAMQAEEIRGLKFDKLVIASHLVDVIAPVALELGVPINKIYWHYYEAGEVISLVEYGYCGLATDDILYAFYDLSVNNMTFDAAIFAVRAELERQRRGLAALHFVIVPTQTVHGGNPGDQYRYGSAAHVNWRLHYIVSPLFRLIEATAGVSILAVRSEVADQLASVRQIFPTGYAPDRPEKEYKLKDLSRERLPDLDLLMLCAKRPAIQATTRMLSAQVAGRRIVTITLREYGFQERRNSDLAAWSRFAEWLDADRYAVVVVRDTSHAFEPFDADLPGLATAIRFDVAAIDLNHRMALYEIAFANLGVSSGPMALCYLSKVPYINLKILCDGYWNTSLEYQEDFNGISEGENFEFAMPWQILCWGEDNFENIRDYFIRLTHVLDTTN